jgi:hypothetical protein
MTLVSVPRWSIGFMFVRNIYPGYGLHLPSFIMVRGEFSTGVNWITANRLDELTAGSEK